MVYLCRYLGHSVIAFLAQLVTLLDQLQSRLTVTTFHAINLNVFQSFTNLPFQSYTALGVKSFRVEKFEIQSLTGSMLQIFKVAVI